MDNQKIGSFIAQLRKEKGLTQKALADILGVTDKAVSKWERGAGYPEITLVPVLAQTLDISVSELLCGETHTAPDTSPEAEPPVLTLAKTDILVTDTIALAEHSHEEKKARFMRILFLSISFCLLTGIFVSLLVNFIISRQFDWSLYVVGGEAVAFLMLAPFFTLKRHRFAASLSGLTISVLPYLFLIERLCPVKGWVIPLALPIVILSLLSLWTALLLFAYSKINRYYLSALMILLFGIFLSLSINGITNRYLDEPSDPLQAVINILSCAFLAAVIFGFGFIRNSKKPKRKE